MTKNMTFFEFIVVYGLPLILTILLTLTIATFFFIKYYLQKNFFDHITENILLPFECEECKILTHSSQAFLKSTQDEDDALEAGFVNFSCGYLKIIPTSKYIQLPYLIRYLSYALF